MINEDHVFLLKKNSRKRLRWFRDLHKNINYIFDFVLPSWIEESEVGIDDTNIHLDKKIIHTRVFFMIPFFIACLGESD